MTGPTPHLDRYVTLQYSVSGRDAAGGVALTWYDLVSTWAAKSPQGGGRLYAAEMKHYEASIVYRIRHRSAVRPGMRLIHGDDVFEIVHAPEVGRREFMDLLCRGIDQDTGDNRDDLNLGDAGTLFDLGDAATNLSRGGARAA
jgi:SPP1 family predicted phage head-tail adaptor